MKRLLVALSSAFVAVLLIPSLAHAISFQPSPSGPMTGVGSNPNWVAVADFNEDGFEDAAVASSDWGGSERGLYILISDGQGGFSPTDASPYSVTYDQAQSARAADLNGDGNMDLLVGVSGNTTFDSFLGDGEGGFTLQGQTYASQGYMDDSAVALGDVDDDSIPDLIISYYGSRYSVSLGEGDGSFDNQGAVVVAGTPGNKLDGFRSIAIGDFNADGDKDLAFGLEPCNYEPPPDSGSPYCSNPDPSANAVFVVKGNGTGAFTPAGGNPHLVTGGNVAKIRSIASGDFNNDGRDDLAVTTESRKLQTFLGSTTSFLVPNPDPNAVLDTGYQPERITVDDLDLDGREDLAWLNYGSSDVGVGLASGDGFLTAEGSPFRGGEDIFARGLGVGDFNGDGAPDLAYLDGDASTMVTLFNSPLIDGDEVNFGEQKKGKTSAPETLTLTNSGVVDAEVTDIEIVGDDADQFNSTDLDACEGTIAAEQDCDISLTFSPTDIGAFGAYVEVTYDGVAEPAEIPIYGGSITSAIDHAPGNAVFDDVVVGAEPEVRSIGVFSTGDAPLEIGNVSLSDDSQFTIVSDNCANTVQNPGQSCHIRVLMKTESVGAKSAELRIASDAASGLATVGLMGNVIEPAPIPPAASISLKSPGKVKRGRTLVVTAKIKNITGGAVAGIVIATVVAKSATPPKAIKLPVLEAGQTITRKIKVKVKKKAKPGKKLKVKVTASAGSRKLSTATKTVKIIK